MHLPLVSLKPGSQVAHLVLLRQSHLRQFSTLQGIHSPRCKRESALHNLHSTEVQSKQFGKSPEHAKHLLMVALKLYLSMHFLQLTADPAALHSIQLGMELLHGTVCFLPAAKAISTEELTDIL